MNTSHGATHIEFSRVPYLRHIIAFGALFITSIAFCSCTKKPSIILATTTSVQDSGILDELIPPFEQEHGIRVKVIAVGSGKAMALGKRGEADILLAHSPAEEERFMNEGYGIRRRGLMKNSFIIVGPPNDPAQIHRAITPTDAFRAIIQKEAIFISRGDNSGTHYAEREIWKKAAIMPDGRTWYQETGLGMGETLSIASEKNGYTLTDSATWAVLKRNLSLTIVWENEEMLFNEYSVIEINPTRFPRIRSKEAQLFADYLFSPGAQNIIAQFGKKTFGESLFIPIYKNDRK